jgi:hypothetical protein
MEKLIRTPGFWADIALLAMLIAGARAGWMEFGQASWTLGIILNNIVICGIGVAALQAVIWIYTKKVTNLSLLTCCIVAIFGHNFYVAKEVWRDWIGMKETIHDWPTVLTYLVPIVVVYGMVRGVDAIAKLMAGKRKAGDSE